MDPQVFHDQLNGLAELLDTQDPDPARSDWVTQAKLLDVVTAGCEWLLDNHSAINAFCDSPDTVHRFRSYLADRCAAGAAVLNAGIRVKQAQAILQRCAQLSPDQADQALYTAGAANLDGFTRAMHARWLFNHGKHKDARRVAASLATAAPPIAELAAQIERAPTPINSAPATFSLNGCGLRFYGDYDHGPDGSKSRVRFVTALWVPLVPVDAYRVRDYSSDEYLIQGKVRLGPIMRAWQVLALALVALAIVWTSVTSFLETPNRQLRLAIDEVEVLARSDDPETALARYEGLADTYIPLLEDDEGEAQLTRVAQGWVGHATAKIPDPITPAAVDQVTAIVARYSALPTRMHQPPLTDPFVDRLLDWSDVLGTETAAAANASLVVLTAAKRFASPNRGDRVDAGVHAARIALGNQLAVDWPLEALRQFGRLSGDPEAKAATQAILAGLPRSKSLLVEVAHEIRLWARADPGDRELARELMQLIVDAEQLGEDPDRLALLQSADEDGLRAALELDPQDQVVVVALADLHRGRGELDEALGLLDALGKPGLMTHDAQYLHASMAFERGDHAGAADLLVQMLGIRLPAFEDARRAYDVEFNGLRERLIRQAEAGNIPAQYSDLTSDNIDKARAAFSRWLDASVAESIALRGLQDAYMRQSDIVPVAILLGTVQLHRARGELGDERQRLLDSAERAFLSIRGDAEGLPSYHMALAQVYYRLGKIAEGDAEFQVLLDDPDPNTQLVAAKGYREIGQVARAREISETVYAAAEPPTKHHAALLRSLLAVDLDDRETWLERSDQTDEFIKTSLLELHGDRLAREGEFADADAKYEQAYALYAARAERENGSYNNAALALLSRHGCTGDVRHVDAAVALMKKSLAMSPDDTIIVGNHASILSFRANLDLLDGFIPTKGLRIGASDTRRLLVELHQSSLHDEFVTRIRGLPGHQRALDAFAQFEALGPQLPSPYSAQLEWYALADNTDAMVKLAARLRSVDGLDTSDEAQAYVGRLAGEFDQRTIDELTTELRGRAAVREQAKRASAATRAALFHLDGVDLETIARTRGLADGEQAVADARAAVAAFEQAQTLWPQGFSTRALADALVLVAILEAGSQDAALAAVWTEHERATGMALTLHTMHERDPALLATLVAHPAFQRSLELRQALPDRALDALDLVLAQLAGNAALRARAHATLQDPRQQVLRELSELFTPYNDNHERTRELIAKPG